MPQTEPKFPVDLRILTTTDLHMKLCAPGGVEGANLGETGLAAVAGLIEEERSTCWNSLLFDNGDFLQGTPTGDYLANLPATRAEGAHPMIAAMNALGFDACTLGNHDFAFGSAFLRKSLRHARFGVVSSNLRLKFPERIQRSLILTRAFRDRSGVSHQLRIGVVGVLPTQTTDWDAALRSTISVSDMAEALRIEIAALRARQADLIVLLAHSGIGAADYRPGMENAATALAAVDGIDVVIAGHTHLVFPSPDFAGCSPDTAIDSEQGTLFGKPAVMAGFWGSHLGVIALELHHDGARWRIARHTSTARPTQNAPPHERLRQIAAPTQLASARHFSRKLARLEHPTHSYFALLGQDAGLRLIAQAQRWHAKRQLRGTRYSSLPILSVVSPARAGGRAGPGHYTAIAPGPLSLHHLADLYPFANRLQAIEMTGAELADWLERAATKFLQLRPGAADQPLIDPRFPTYNFDVIDGLSWEIDLSQPARYSPAGALFHPEAARIREISHFGRIIEPNDPFLLVTNSYRLSRAGPYAGLTLDKPVLLDDGRRTRDILRRYVTAERKLAPAAENGWRFRAMPGTTVLFDTATEAASHLAEIAAFRPEDLGVTESGLLRLRLSL
ncbi:bifunctional 2',3'-cyclic-nucleotide 2'-phosphodiesterase/3'-nucleotidase [Paracoccus aminophilus]|uniref:2',3'-cyclic-nucleotide 2'-phosphodiesterase n=1 Tax=Paracoccus aminophilus JCM 7686 TaxID=1367847 RepID=S5XVH2_PARAH|nr:bifunctional 2',3'-cyclic-nucleotide 2'-phosphodiesterase/3'-nucleotidase [Paracoccus aminophilus]AGT09257.1 2',3'-cyclic-nucleotide 2'-phosphodiesterase [Paracoccus aminophilus JCM 7686]